VVYFKLSQQGGEKNMCIKMSKCETCKHIISLDEAPWAVCLKYPESIPLIIFGNTIDSDKPVNCDKYEYNPDWNK